MKQQRAIIIGAGPAGLTAAYELLKRTSIRPLVLEKSQYMGGISRTVNYKGNRIDIGGHRFFSKSDRVMKWWLEILPLEAQDTQTIHYHRMTTQVTPASERPRNPDRVMLVRPRKSRIYYLRRFFDYPISLSWDTLSKLGVWRTIKIALSYLRSMLAPIRPERTLEQFFINRFGRELYLTFFKSYTEKVWGVPCREISAEWGAQRIKGLSVWTTLKHALRKLIENTRGDIRQKEVETSLIEQFLYPKYGPGQMWEEVACRVQRLGGEIRTQWRAERIFTEGWRVTAIEAVNEVTGERELLEGDYFFSTAPVSEIVRAFVTPPPANVLEVADGLVYRDFITVGLLVRSLKISDETPHGKKLIRDNWIYIQEPDVLLGRLQIFNNWSPFLVADPNTVWLGLEYFCQQSDPIWKMTDPEMTELAIRELAQIGILDTGEVIDSTVIRMEKTYPAYFGTYSRFQEIRDYVDRFENLFLVGRNGMHRYNNQDHSMLTAMMAVDNIVAGEKDKARLWEVNTEMEYHEEKKQ
ncbi:MAG: NAD(P)/FAD-dependent oxidoreductase [Bryobacteraceae bacterium]|nr:NAD(P)/FAD-dependent oxidoreductase [Bryobacteraceae bacterium]MDW8377532.1 NAD(P)/FAD-dependent oxidoreductase [Bryobacterales bacterium]